MHNQVANWLYYRWLSGDHIAEQFIHSLVSRFGSIATNPRCNATEWVAANAVRPLSSEMFTIIFRSSTNGRTVPVPIARPDRWMDATTKPKTMSLEPRDGQVWPMKSTGHHPGSTSMRVKVANRTCMISSMWLSSKAIREGKVINNGKYMCYSTMMALMGREACYSGKVITWEQCMKSPQDFTPPAYEFGKAPEVVVHQPGYYVYRIKRSFDAEKEI